MYRPFVPDLLGRNTESSYSSYLVESQLYTGKYPVKLYVQYASVIPAFIKDRTTELPAFIQYNTPRAGSSHSLRPLSLVSILLVQRG